MNDREEQKLFRKRTIIYRPERRNQHMPTLLGMAIVIALIVAAKVAL